MTSGRSYVASSTDQAEATASHLDVRFLIVARPGAVPTARDESEDARWFARDALPDDLEPTIHQMLALARSRLGS